jgi:hypothetical protein
MEIHVYLNGELLERSRTLREKVIAKMQRDWQAALFFEWVMNSPRNREQYLKMRFVTPKS